MLGGFACRKLLETFQKENVISNLYLIYIKEYDQMQPITFLACIGNMLLIAGSKKSKLWLNLLISKKALENIFIDGLNGWAGRMDIIAVNMMCLLFYFVLMIKAFKIILVCLEYVMFACMTMYLWCLFALYVPVVMEVNT